MSDSNGGRMFFRGVPTEPDVIRLVNAFGVPSETDPIRYEEAARVIGSPVRSNRFRTVTTAWRKQVKAAHGVLVMARDGAFRARKPGERISFGKSKTRSSVRAAGVALDAVMGADRSRLTDVERADADKVQRVASSLRFAAQAEARRAAEVTRARKVLEATTRK